MIVGLLVELDKLAMRIVGGFLGDDGEAALHGLDDAGQIVDVVGQIAALNGFEFFVCHVCRRCRFLDTQAAMLPECCNGFSRVAVYFHSVGAFFFFHDIFV